MAVCRLSILSSPLSKRKNKFLFFMVKVKDLHLFEQVCQIKMDPRSVPNVSISEMLVLRLKIKLSVSRNIDILFH